MLAIWSRTTLGFLALFGATSCLTASYGVAQDAAAGESVSYTKQIQPLLAKRCYACHGPDEAEGGLRLSDAEGAFAETDSGSHAILPGNVDDSLLLQRVSSEDPYERMPPEGDPLTTEEIALLRQWIADGATWERHWAFEPREMVSPPSVAVAGWSANLIDAFIAARLESKGLKPNAPADKQTLVRRAYLDLWGLPPTEEQVREFVDNTAEDAWEQLIDQLLSSHHYGERWGRHWLDLVRYAETNSFERDGVKPNAWKYRDYVIRSFNDDKPYDQFIREQLAGDELDQVTHETLTATGFYRLGIWDDEPADPLLARYDELDDLITTFGQVMLGLTINCSRCHDHKIDPIPQAEYYQMAAYFADVTPYGTRGNQSQFNQLEISPDGVPEQYQALDQKERELNDKLRAIEQEGIVKMPAPDQRATEGREREKVLKEKLQEHLSPERWEEYSQLKKEKESTIAARRELPNREFVLGLAKTLKSPEPTTVMLRGNPHVPGDVVEPGIPGIFGDPNPSISPPANNESTGRRRALADWITSADNLLTARVMANRVWQYHFGRGIVRSSNNFGQLGTPPTHPLLLDWLAQQLVDGDWKLKSLHRQIMTSQAYQMSSLANEEGLAKDPGNDLYWRFDPRRLSAEEVRDGILVATGSLNPEPYGPSMYPTLSAEVLAGQSVPGSGWGNSSPEQQNRRSVYIHVKRSLLTPMLSVFDYPEPDRSCEARFATLQPGQALALMNSDFINDQSRTLAKRVKEQAGDDRQRQIDSAVRFVLGRPATEVEIEAGIELMSEIETDYKLNTDTALQLYCLTVLNWNEFMFVD